MKALHVTVRGSTLRCGHCAAERQIPQPGRMRSVVEAAQAFLEVHQGCPKPIEASVVPVVSPTVLEVRAP